MKLIILFIYLYGSSIVFLMSDALILGLGNLVVTLIIGVLTVLNKNRLGAVKTEIVTVHEKINSMRTAELAQVKELGEKTGKLDEKERVEKKAEDDKTNIK